MAKKTDAVTALTSNEKPQGYTIDELRYRLALVTLKTEFTKEKLINTYNATLSASPLGGKKGSSPVPFWAGPAFGSLLKGLSYADYFLMAFSVFKTARSVFSFFKTKTRR